MRQALLACSSFSQWKHLRWNAMLAHHLCCFTKPRTNQEDRERNEFDVIHVQTNKLNDLEKDVSNCLTCLSCFLYGHGFPKGDVCMCLPFNAYSDHISHMTFPLFFHLRSTSIALVIQTDREVWDKCFSPVFRCWWQARLGLPVLLWSSL